MEPIDTRKFVRFVRQALAALYDYPRLQTSPLAKLLAGDLPDSDRGPALHRALVHAIENLRPASVGVGAASYRRYQYLYLRYVDVRDIADVVPSLGVSLRQARRDQHEAVSVLASRLYDAYRTDRPAIGGGRPPVSSISDLALDAEVERLDPVKPAIPTDGEELITSVLDTLRPLAQARGVSLYYSPSPAAIAIAPDRAIARQILISAASHAIVTGHDGPVQLRLARRQRSVKVTIRFSPKGAAGGESADEDRLARCRRLLALVQGGLATNACAADTELVVTFPAADHATILVVDDNADARRLLRRYLAVDAHRVVEASGYADALDLARSAEPMVILLDIMLPGHDGWELLQRLKQDPRTADLPVIVCSALGDRDLALALGAADVLEKPVTQEALRGAVARRLQPARAQRHRAHAGDSASPREW